MFLDLIEEVDVIIDKSVRHLNTRREQCLVLLGFFSAIV